MNSLKQVLKMPKTALGRPLSNKVGITVGALLAKWRAEFESSGIDEPRESILNILSHCLHTKTLGDVYRSKAKQLPVEQIAKIEDLCRERLKSVPIQYIVGEWEFRGLTLAMRTPVFIPRPETEQLVDIVSREIRGRNVGGEIIDICCGSGAVGLALLRENPMIRAIAVDQSPIACELTRLNAHKNGLDGRIRVISSDLGYLDFNGEKFDIIVSNPPYVYTGDLVDLQPEIALYEDLRALDGGEDGLSVIKALLEKSSHLLSPGGKLFLEVEPRHPPLLSSYLKQRSALGLSLTTTYPDFLNTPRFVQIIKSS